jgi:hypothetical protein
MMANRSPYNNSSPPRTQSTLGEKPDHEPRLGGANPVWAGRIPSGRGESRLDETNGGTQRHQEKHLNYEGTKNIRKRDFSNKDEQFSLRSCDFAVKNLFSAVSAVSAVK